MMEYGSIGLRCEWIGETDEWRKRKRGMKGGVPAALHSLFSPSPTLLIEFLFSSPKMQSSPLLPSQSAHPRSLYSSLDRFVPSIT